ncbi:MAG: hypothetical protein ACKPJO_18945, partial [Dolichospermum sp.]
ISVVQFFDVVLNKSCLPRFYRKTKYLVDSILSHSHTFGALRYRSCKKGIVVTPLAVPSADYKSESLVLVLRDCGRQRSDP